MFTTRASTWGEEPPSGRSPALLAGRRRAGPGRAALGALLVVVAGIGVVAAWGDDTGPAPDLYLAMARDVVPGEILTSDDLTSVAIALPPTQRAQAFTDAHVVDGAVAVAALRRGQLLQSTDVAETVEPGRAEVSVGVPPQAAMQGDRRFLRPGLPVEVFVTRTDAGRAVTERVTADAVVVEVLGEGDRLGSSGDLTVVLSVPEGDAGALAGAAASGSLALVRTGGGR